MSRLADIYKSEKKSGGGILSTIGKRTLEKIDPRQLFDQSGMLAAMAPTLFKKYSATSMKKEKPTLSPTPQSPLQDAKMDLIIKQNQDVITNTKISAKNSLMFPGMARDMNVMRQNMVKMVKLQGGTAATKADMFFKTAKEREAEYEVKFQKDRPVSPTPTVSKDKPEGKGGILGMLSGIIPAILSGIGALGGKVLSSIGGAISGLGSLILQGITSALSVDNLMKALGATSKAITSIIDLATKIAVNPVFLAIAGITSIAMLLDHLRGKYDAGKERYMELAAKKQQQGSLTPEEEGELKTLQTPNYRREAKEKLGFDPESNRAVSEKESSQSTQQDVLTRQTDINRFKDQAALQLQAEGKDPTLKNIEDRAKLLLDQQRTTPNESAAETQRLMSKKPVQVFSAPSRAPTATQTNGVELLNRAMDKEGITDPIVRDRVSQLAMVESSMNPAAKGPVIPSGMHKGDQAQGLLQIMPKTAEGVGFSREQIADPETAAIAGVRYFKMNLKRFNDNLDAATVAHHSGPGGAKRWLESGSAGTKDLATGLSTDNYLTKVAGSPTLAPSMATLAAAPPMATLAAATPTRPSSIISDSTVALSRVKEESSSAPIVVNAPQTVNNMQQGSQAVAQYTAPSIVDSEFMRMLVSRAV